jgi:hypothetical protein
MPHRLIVSFGLLCGLMSIAGCTPDAVGPVVPVKGKVTVDDQPLKHGAVAFHPDTNKGNTTPHEPHGEIDGEGNYTLFTTDRAGAPPGWYRVSVISQTSTATEQNPYAAPISNIAAKYGDPNTSGLAVEVKAGADPSSYDLKVSK